MICVHKLFYHLNVYPAINQFYATDCRGLLCSRLGSDRKGRPSKHIVHHVEFPQNASFTVLSIPPRSLNPPQQPEYIPGLSLNRRVMTCGVMNELSQSDNRNCEVSLSDLIQGK